MSAASALGLLPLLLLLLWVRPAPADPCHDGRGRPRFCLPPPIRLAGGPVPAANLTLALGGPFLLASVRLRFCSPRPPVPLLLLSLSGDGGRGWRPFGGGPAREGAGVVAFRAPPGSPGGPPATHVRAELGPAGPRLGDIRVRGRCQCHGHAARCAARARPPRCRCRHHTAGPGCQDCRPTHRDRPWRPATPRHPHPCHPCTCNRHSRRCRFNAEVYHMSGRRSGGVCQHCRHHTAGRHCHYCQAGYKRDPAQPMTSRRACRACQCHPIGAIGGVCNQTSGQCQCKPGVTGLTCSRCAQGYQQSRSARLPCQRECPGLGGLQSFSPDPTCQSHCNASYTRVHMSLQRYCQQDYVLRARIESAVPSGAAWWRLGARVLAVYKQRREAVRRGEQDAWVPRRDLTCGCLRLSPGGTYLLLGSAAGGPDPSRLVLDRHGLALPWRPGWARKLRQLQQEERRGGCRPAGPGRTPSAPDL
uniref:Netrin-5 n=1 Tax=Ornithorhynchus anatinus TaxID=9258 RepID=A0A6I8PKI6_ORNAN